MTKVSSRERDNEGATKAGAGPEHGMFIPETGITFKILGCILALWFTATMQSAYGSDHFDTSPAGMPATAPPVGSSMKTTTAPSSVGLSSLVAGSEKVPEIVWEPIGKYSQKEIDQVSDTAGELFNHMKKMEAIDSSVAALVRGGDKAVDKGAMLRAAKSYSVDALEESKKIDQFAMPALKNQQAAQILVKAKTALKNASEIQKVRASKLVKMISGDGDSKVLSAEIQQLGSQRISAAFQFVIAYMAYESYGYTSEQIDLTTGRLKKNAKPDRLEPAPQTAKKRRHSF